MRIPPSIVLSKKRGETPLQAIEAWKSLNPEWAEVRAAYAGRLDPMAEGKLLILLGEECKKLTEYRGLDKEYVVEMVLDVSTDTGDVLGMPRYSGIISNPTDDATRKAISKEIGTYEQHYPVFSSKTVQGKPLFLYALDGTLGEISIPTHFETVYKIQVMDQYLLTLSEMRATIQELLAVVPRSTAPSKALGADFRQDAIRDAWSKTLERIEQRTFRVIRLKIVCGSGAYMRTLVQRIAKNTDTTAIALSITRTKLGSYHQFGRWSFWTHSF